MEAPLHTHPRLIACIALVLASVLCLPIQHEPQQQPFILPAASLIEVPYADWAHHHWVWFHNSQNNQANNTKLVQDYLDRGIKVGVLNIDSGWETGYNSFVFNPAKFPDPKTMIDQFHAQGIKVTTWITSMVNIDSPNFQYCLDNGYFLNNGQLVEWWRGTGAFFDYTHPRGLDYWHGLMKNVLDLGVDGWKTDGTDPYFFLLGPNVRGYSGRVTQEYYAEFYYADFYNYTNVVKGDRQALIMSRPVDTGHSFSPYYVMFSGWVGDQESDFGGLKKALTNMLQSAFRNYLNFGSDIAGYRSSDTIPRTKELLLRWTQLSAFNPLMENGGSGEHRPWMYGDDVSEIYRRFVDIHYSLCTFFLNAGTQAYAAGRSVMMPLGQDLPVPDRFDFVLWHDIFVSPILDYGTQFEVQIPDGRWVDWWDATRVFSGPTTIQYDCPYDRFPVFTRAGAIIPLDLEYNGLYAHDHKGKKSPEKQVLACKSPPNVICFTFILSQHFYQFLLYRVKQSSSKRIETII
eukprot:TRINITY_DN2044_c0_g1_i1.p1 TRINITY_DN2044_c0_g1~~TRINITY_DN2044_c0_g1_i1.p1  ORF type:complete len:516 (-),score=63.40 TRINITY_DN2044_c0_g1_i1:877-2424(-)